MNPSRRLFLRRTLVTGSIISFGGYVPRFLAATNRTQAAAMDRKLVVIFLEGGNDGLNMVIPVRDPLYQKYRPETAVAAGSSLPLTDELSLHPEMRGVADVWEAGRLAVLQGVGYPGHSRSHFVSQAVWHAARLNGQPETSEGWLGRSLDRRQAVADAPLAFSAGFAETPTALRGRATRTAVPPEVSADEARRIQALLARNSDVGFSSGKEQQVARIQQDAVSSLAQFASMQAAKRDGFPKTHLGETLSQVAWLIRSGSPACVYYLRQSGYDTHAGQPPIHGRLLRELADALRAFDQSISDEGLSPCVTVMVFSEFGRRVAENRSGGTDHGAAGPVLLVGGNYKPGVHGTPIDLGSLDDGAVTITTDFRNVYATLLQNSLGVDPKVLLPDEFQPLAGVRS